MFLLYPFSLFYRVAVSLRNSLYDWSVLEKRSLPVPVVSVGNLSSGGTGKTSLVRFIAQELSPVRRVVVLLRGYKRKSKGVVVVSRWGETEVNVREAGDEAYMLAKLLPNASVVVAEDRFEGGMRAVRELSPELILLDDGFQHRRLHRDIDIVLLRKRDLTDRLLPAGLLREPLNSLERSDCIVLSYQETEPFEFSYVGKPVFKMFREFCCLRNSNMEEVSLEEVRDKEITAFAGLGSNEQFFNSLKSLGFKVERMLSLPDHYDYRDFKIDNSKLYITTLKDMVKLPPMDNLFALDFRVKVDGLIEFISNSLQE